MWGAIYWLINFPLICCLFFFPPALWVKLGIFITLSRTAACSSVLTCVAIRYFGVASAPFARITVMGWPSSAP